MTATQSDLNHSFRQFELIIKIEKVGFMFAKVECIIRIF